MTQSQQEVSFCNIARELIPRSDFLTASILAMEVRKQLNDDLSTPDHAYATLLQVADHLGLFNPFTNKKQFYSVYNEILQISNFDWELVMEYDINTMKGFSVMSELLFNLYYEKFGGKLETILVAEAEKFVPNLRKMVVEHPEVQFVFTTQNKSYEIILQNAFAQNENVEILMTNIYQYEFTTRRFDLIFAFPAFGGRMLVENQKFICREYEMVALENLALHLNDCGHLIITLPARVTFAAGKVNELRKFIQQTYSIREILELPSGIIDGTFIKIYFFDIENTRPSEDGDIIIKKFSGIGKKKIEALKVEKDMFVMSSELEEYGDWNLSRIFAQQDEEYQAFQQSETRKEKLGHIAQIFRGKAINSKNQFGNIGVLNISNLGNYEINYDGLDHIQEEERKVMAYLLHEGDILLTARGTVIRTAVFHAQKYPCIASANLIIIRPDPKILNSTYLKIFLDSPIGKKAISGAQQGLHVMNISYRDLGVLDVPLPALEEQQSAANEYLAELSKYESAIATAEKNWSETLQKLHKF